MGVGDAGSSALQGAGAGSAFGPWGAAIGAGAGLLNYELFQRPQYQKQLALAAATQRFSPWTHMQAQAPSAPNPMGSALGMASAGASLGQGISNAQNSNAMNNAYMDYLNRSAPPGAGATMASMPSPSPSMGGWLNTGPGLPPGYGG